jgi:ribonuclease HI
LEIAKEKKISHLSIKGDSKLVCKQLVGEWQTKSENLKSVHAETKDLVAQSESIKIEHIPRLENRVVGNLSKMRENFPYIECPNLWRPFCKRHHS